MKSFAGRVLPSRSIVWESLTTVFDCEVSCALEYCIVLDRRIDVNATVVNNIKARLTDVIL
jgi:hypothetical protein